MQKSGGSKRFMRVLGVGVLVGCVTLSMGMLASTSSADDLPTPTTSTVATDDGSSDASTTPPPIVVQSQPAGTTPPYGTDNPVTLETSFSRPVKAISSQANSDFSLLNELERLIRGSYRDPVTGNWRPEAERKANHVYLSISRMEDSHRVGRELIAAAKAGVHVDVIHGKASQSKESRSLQSNLNNSTFEGKHYGRFHICNKGKSLACLSSLNGAIMHSKLLYIWSTYNRNNEKVHGAIWTGSANLGGPSGERTWNNGVTIYNDMKLNHQIQSLWDDMWQERGIGNDYLSHVRDHGSDYGFSASSGSFGYTSTTAKQQYYVYPDGSHSAPVFGGMFYSNLANVTIYQTPLYATPSNGKDPVMNALNRVIPDDDCHIRVQNNRFKYRRIAVAQKLVELANRGCTVEAIAFEDDLAVNRTAHCQQYLRICKPILDVFRTANVRIPAAYAKPHDKIITIDALMTRNKLNPEELQANGQPYPFTGGVRTKFVQTGSANMTGSNLVVSDEIFLESTDPQVFADYLQHWKAIWKSHEHKDWAY